MYEDKDCCSTTRVLSTGVPDPVRQGSPYIEHVTQAKPGMKVFPDKLYIVTPVINIQRFRSRIELFRQFERHMHESGAILYVIEAAFGDRPFEVTDPNNPQHVQVRTNSVLWLKENLQNLCVQHLPLWAQRIAFIDADLMFKRPDWVQETLQLLQHYAVIQMFSQIQDASPDHEMVTTHYPNSFVHTWLEGNKPLWQKAAAAPPYPEASLEAPLKDTDWYGPPGGAWAWRRDALDAVGGLLDKCVVGSSDYYMARALFGHVDMALTKPFTEEYKRTFKLWEARAERYIRRNVGYMNGAIFHSWHGKKSQRGYGVRDEILTKYAFNPVTDLARNSQGVYYLVDHGDVRSVELRNALRNYLGSRNEDSIDVAR